MRLELEIALQFALSMLETFSRQDFALVLAGIRTTASGRELDRLLDRWHRQQVITRNGRGQTARFRISDEVRSRIETTDPIAEWGRRWDGKWRIFSFDLPESRRRDRVKLWEQLRAARFGFLQRSVWVWPHDVEPSLRQMVEARGIPECFCGFEAERLFLCDTAEVVAVAWDWKRIGHNHTSYLERRGDTTAAIRRAEGLEDLARIARTEYGAYRAAFQMDPFLPRTLWPESYRGPAVHQRHREIQDSLRLRIRGLPSA